MPAYNEADGLPGFLDEIAAHVGPLAERVSIVVVDDVSTDDTAAVLSELSARMPELVVSTAPRNRGHGPTALAAYRAGLALDPDLLIHVDGDGQFLGADFPRIVRALEIRGVDVVHGVRRGRADPWYRTAITACVGAVVALVAGRRVPDVNTPLRGYRPAALRTLIGLVPEEALVPHVHFSLAEKRLGLVVRYVRVRSIPRRGDAQHGTMWGPAPAAPRLPPRRLRAFVRAAGVELWRVSLAPGSAARRAARRGTGER